MRSYKVPVVGGKPKWEEAEWDHQGCPHYFTENFSPIEVLFIKEGLTIGIKKFLWVSEDVQVKDNKFRYVRLGYMPSSSIGGLDRGEPWMLLEVDQLGELFNSALRAFSAVESAREPSALEAQLREDLEDAQEDRDRYRAEWLRLNRQYEQMQSYLGELLSVK